MLRYIKLILFLFLITVFLGCVCFLVAAKKQQSFFTAASVMETGKNDVYDDKSIVSAPVQEEALNNAEEESKDDNSPNEVTEEDSEDLEDSNLEQDEQIDDTVYVERIKINFKDKSPYISVHRDRSITAKKGTAFYLKTKIKPSDATDKKVLWVSDNEEAVKVMEDGKVCAMQCGVARVTAVAADTRKVADTILVTVDKIEKKDSILVAHRGKCDDAPENSLAAIELALQEGQTHVEFDVWETVDHQFVVSHDESLLASCDKDILVTDLTLKEAMECQIVNGNQLDQYSDECIPSLEQVLSVATNYDGFLHIELKEELSKKMLKKLRKSIAQYTLEDRVKIITFSQVNIARMRELEAEGLAEIPMEYLCTEWSKEVFNVCKKYHTDIGISYDKISPKIVEKCHSKEIKVNAWTVNDFASAYKLVYTDDVDAITSDYFLID